MVIKIVVLTTALWSGLMQPSVLHYVAPSVEVQKIEPAEIILAEVSAYTNSPDETDADNMITASGKVAEGNIVACPSRFNFGTKVEINGKIYVCEDRMNARYRDGDYFDILVETKEEAYNWGRRTVEVSIRA